MEEQYESGRKGRKSKPNQEIKCITFSEAFRLSGNAIQKEYICRTIKTNNYELRSK